MRLCSCAKLAATSPSILTGVPRASRSWLFGADDSTLKGAPPPHTAQPTEECRLSLAGREGRAEWRRVCCATTAYACTSPGTNSTRRGRTRRGRCCLWSRKPPTL
eukprot:4262210-Prymnesium_polylepis.1